VGVVDTEELLAAREVPATEEELLLGVVATMEEEDAAAGLEFSRLLELLGILMATELLELPVGLLELLELPIGLLESLE